jgi:hypothetical protein
MQNLFGEIICVQENVPHAVSQVHDRVVPEILFKADFRFKRSDEVFLEVLEDAPLPLVLEVLPV